MKRIKTAFFILLFLFVSANILYAKEVNIVYTGQTHAMLYPCSCPVQQDGGIARRATLIKQLKKKDPRLFLLDCGSFTAGNLIDEYAQNTLLDMQRSLVNFKAMELMGYDAVGLSQDEFNFGMEYFLKIAKSDKPVFLSANLKSEKVSPYMVKNINGVKIGIIGLTGLYAGNKAGLKVSEPVKKTAELIDQLKAKGVQVIIIISNLGEKEDLKLIAEVKGIDIVFVGQNPLKEEQISRVGSVFVLRPSWQGRKLGKLTLEIKNGILENCKAEQITLSDKIADDPNILKILPRCYSDSNCRKEGFVGVCNNPGDLKAECDFIMPSKITMKVITARDCAVCKSDQVVNSLKRRFPGLTVEYLYYPDQSTENLIKELSITALPVYIFGKDIEGEKGFENIKNDFIHRGDFYWLKPERSGLSFFIDRKKKSKELDLFFSIFDKDIDKLLNAVKDFKPELHFLAIEGGMGFDAKKGNQEVGEYLRAVCMQKYQPQVLWDYLVCRAKNINDSDWESCAKGVNLTRVNKCAVGKEGQKLLRENISLNKELKILFGPVYLLNNQEIFSSAGAPDKEELERIIKK